MALLQNRRTWLLASFGTTVLLWTCSQVERATTQTASEEKGPGPIQIQYEEAYSDLSESQVEFGPDLLTRGSEAGELLLVGIERTECYGTCPAYVLGYCSEGFALRCGFAHVPYQGCFAGRISKEQFLLLAAIVKDIGFSDLKPAYLTWKTDEPTTFYLAETVTEKRIVRNYAESAPPRIWLLGFFLDYLAEGVEWREVDAESDQYGRCSQLIPDLNQR